MTIPVICDRCRAEGFAGDELFADIADLLDFTPVPVRKHVNNWTDEVQRAFVAALAITGSPARAARAIGRYPAGAERLRKQRGGSSFGAAWDAAIDFARERELFRLKDNMADLAEQYADRPPAPDRRGRPSAYSSREDDEPFAEEWIADGPASPEDEGQQSQQWLDSILAKYWHKVVAERQARLNGEIVAADFYLRQMTSIEISIDVASGGKGLEQLQRLRLDGRHLTEIAETPFSRLIDHMRRHIWRQMGEPERPEHPPRRLLVEHDGYATEPLESTKGGLELGHDEQKAVFKQEHEKAAEAQMLWEARAIAEHKERSRSDK